ncbi:MAG: PEP-CTERM sorting domain-containing protein [Desulfobaccales bacterium]
MKKFGALLLSFAVLVSLASFAGAYEVESSGPLNSTSINFFVENDGPGTINSVVFSLLSPFDIETPVFNVINPAGVTSTDFYLDLVEPGHYAKFGFDFTGFTSGAGTFSFAWDPDKVGDPDYGAIIGDLVGTLVTIYTSEGKYCGQLVIDGDHLEANLCCFEPVPVPGALLLFGSGLLGLVGFRRKAYQLA